MSQIDRSISGQLWGLLSMGLLCCGCRSQPVDTQAEPAAPQKPPDTASR